MLYASPSEVNLHSALTSGTLGRSGVVATLGVGRENESWSGDIFAGGVLISGSD
jgi:hypothetical protein